MAEIITIKDGDPRLADLLNNDSIIVEVEREFDEPCDDPCEGCPLSGSFSTDAMICCASCR
jgi:hypothetical protein